MKFTFGLSFTVKIEKRVVTSITNMLGEVGGLYGIIIGLAYFLLGKFPEKMFLIHQVRALFRAADLDESSPPTVPLDLTERQTRFSSIKMGWYTHLKLSQTLCCNCLLSTRDRKLKKLLALGDTKII